MSLHYSTSYLVLLLATFVVGGAIAVWRERRDTSTVDSKMDPILPAGLQGALEPQRAPFAPGEIQWPDTPFDLAPSVLLVARRGSESHGTYIPSTDPNSIDDRDLLGVCVPPALWTLGLRSWEGTESIKGVWDVVLYDFRKFVRLVCKQNPNVVGMLWLDPEDYLYRSPAADRLIAARDAFRARQPAYDAFSGYAHAQLKKMSSGAFRGYMGDKRKALVAKHGYDVKNACHLVRLLHMGEEFQRTGRLEVRRTWDREMLMDIKRGQWTLARVQAYADERASAMKRALAESVLPEAVDLELVEELTVSIMREHLLRDEHEG